MARTLPVDALRKDKPVLGIMNNMRTIDGTRNVNNRSECVREHDTNIAEHRCEPVMSQEQAETISIMLG